MKIPNNRQMDLFAIWNRPQLTHHEVCDMTSLKYEQLRRWQSRELSSLALGSRSPATQGRRLYTPGELFMLLMIKSLSDAGLPIRLGAVLAQNARMHSEKLLVGIPANNYTLFIWPTDEGKDWEIRGISDESEREEIDKLEKELPPIYTIIDVEKIFTDYCRDLLNLIDEDEEESNLSIGDQLRDFLDNDPLTEENK